MSKLYNKKEDVKSFVLEKKKQKLPKGLRRETTTGEGANIIKIDNFGSSFVGSTPTSLLFGVNIDDCCFSILLLIF